MQSDVIGDIITVDEKKGRERERKVEKGWCEQKRVKEEREGKQKMGREKG